MKAHCTLETLSTYVDAELSGSDRLVVESHIEKCEECRKRLSRLQKVVGQLRRLEEVEAPPALAWEVQRQVRLERGQSTLGQRVEERLGRLLRQPLLAPLFAVIIAFGAIFYLLSLGVASQSASGTRVVIGTSEAEVAGVDATAAPAGVSSGQAAPTAAAVSAQREAVTEDFPPASEPAPMALSESEGAGSAGVTTALAGRAFRLTDGVWVESGLEGREAERRIDLAAGETLPEALGWLRERQGTWRVRLGDSVVEVRGGPVGESG